MRTGRSGKGHAAVKEVLLAKDGDPNSKSNYRRTPLWYAAGEGHAAVVELLLAKDGVDSNSKDTYNGRTALSLAAEKRACGGGGGVAREGRRRPGL